MRRLAVRKHLEPVVLGIAIGLIAGFCHAVPALITTGIVKHRLYYSIACVLRESINPYVLMACLVLYAIHVGTMLKVWLRVLCFALVGFTCIYIVGRLYDFHYWLKVILRDANLTMLKEFISLGFIQIISSAIIVVLGILFLRHRRRKIAERMALNLGNRADNRISTPVLRAVTVLKRSTALSVAIFVAVLGLNFIPALLQVKNAHDMRRAPNIIYIMVDTLRADHLGCYGYSRNTSPNIDRFAEQSTRFGKAISQAPWTSASIASFMSSRYLHVRVGVALPTNVVLMPELLKNRGYATAAVISNPVAGKESSLDRGYDRYYEMSRDSVSTIRGKQTLPLTVFSKSLEMLGQMKKQRFFLFAHFMGPHAPYASHKGYDFFPGYKGKLSREGVDLEGIPPAGDDLKYTIALYDEEIAFTDHYIGLLFAELEKLDLYDNTLIVILADHGEEFVEHGRMSHGHHLYEEAISVPLIVKLPGQKIGSTVGGAFSLINLLPSIANYINCDTSALEFQGTAVPLRGLRRVRPASIYSSTDFHETKLQCLRSETSKLIVNNKSNKAELYDIEKDPDEELNIAADFPKTTSAFQSELRSVDAQIDAALKHTITKALTPEEQQALQKSMRALGYLQ